jgi:RNA polymerase sigma-70 factor (ECF subfamily)
VADDRDSRPAAGEDEAAVVVRARADPAAFAPLYERYLDPVYRYCYRRLGNREAAEDATSVVFTRALASIGNYQDGSFAGWLFAIAHNVVVDCHRRRRPVQALPEIEPADSAPSPEEAALAADERRSVRALLAALPEDQRRVLELRLAGLRGVDIAVALGRSPGAIKMLQLRAMTRLRADLGVATRANDQETDDAR